MEELFRINDVLTALLREFQVPFDSESEEDAVLNDLTHEIAKSFRVGPYRIGPRQVPTGG
jgi:hypothetical protein